MPHFHRLPDGRETAVETVDQDNPNLHWHMVEGARTSSGTFGPNHTHTLGDELTSGPIEVDTMDEDEKSRETKELGGHVVKSYVGTKIDETDPQGQFGFVEGYIATWDIDRGDYFGVKDQFTRGAFTDSIADHLKRRRNIRLKDHHGRTVGNFPIDTIKQDERGLFGVGKINLKVQQGRELFELVKDGTISDFSIGFSVDEFTIDGDLRTITKATIWEGSLVDEPMNPFANVIGFKSVVAFQDLPLASQDREWDSSAAIARVKEFTDSDEEPSSSYRNAFVWFDRENDNVFSGYKLPIADVIDGRLTVIPRAIFAAAAAIQGARGGVDIPESDRPGVIRHLERYYAKMDLDSPFNEERQYYGSDDVKELDCVGLEKTLRASGMFSRKAAKAIAHNWAPYKQDEIDNEPVDKSEKLSKNLLDDIKRLTKDIKSS